MEFIIPVILSIVGIILFPKLPTTARKVLLIIILVIIIALLGCRYRVGIDTLSYMRLFKDTPTLSELLNPKILDRKHEPLYLLVCTFCRTFSKEFWPVQFVMATITNGCVFIFLYRYCKNAFLGVFLYCILQWLYFSTEIMRESAAIGIFLLNFQNLQNKKWAKYYLYSLFSIGFHYSAIIILFFPFIRFLKLNLFFYISCIAILAITPLVEDLNTFLSLGVITDKINVYIDEADKNNLNWKIANFIKTAFPSILAIILFKIKNKKVQFQPFLLFQIILCCGAFAIPQVFQRFTNYTFMFTTVALANIITIGSYKPTAKTIIISILLASQSLYYYNMRHVWYPYVSIFNPVVIKERESFYRKIFW